jgi:tetratricopeptide (TPR) repeat protein
MKPFILLVAIFIGLHGVAQVPKNAQQAYAQAMAKVNEGKFVESLAFFKKATDIYPSYYEAFLEAAGVFGKLQIYNDAKFCYNKAIQLRPKSCTPYIRYGTFFKESRHRSDSALMYFEKAVKLQCDTSADLCFNMSWCYNDKKQFAKAIAQLKKLIAADNTNKKYINEISFSYHQSNAPQDGIDYFEPLYELTKLDLYKFYIGIYHLELKQKDKALKDYEELVALKSKLADKLEKRIKAAP